MSSGEDAGQHWLGRYLRRTVQLESREVAAFVTAFLLFFCVMAGYFSVRSVRETAGTILGDARVTQLFTYTFVVALAIVPSYGWVIARFRRSRFLPLVYGGVALALALVGVTLQLHPRDRFVMEFFFVMISVLNLFIVSVFFAFLLEIFSQEQTKRLFGSISAGGSFGALAGPTATALLARSIGDSGVLYMGAGFFVLAVICQRVLLWVWQSAPATHGVVQSHDRPVGGNPWIDGARLLFSRPYILGIGIFVVFLSSITTFLYFEQLKIVRAAFPITAERTQVFASIDAVVEAATFALQFFLTGRMAKRLGVIALVTIIPATMIGGYLILAAFSTFAVLAAVMIVRRVGEYAFVRPGREMLFSAISTEDRYRVKHVVDVPVYRGADVMSAQLQYRLGAAGVSPQSVLLLGAGIAGLWFLNGWWLGRRMHGETLTSQGAVAAAPPTPAS